MSRRCLVGKCVQISHMASGMICSWALSLSQNALLPCIGRAFLGVRWFVLEPKS